MTPVAQIVWGSVLLSLVHALIPNHWLPLVAIAREQRWSKRDTMVFTTFVGAAHVAGTVLLGMAIGFFGASISKSHELVAALLGPLILISLGGVFIFRGLRHSRRCNHHKVHLLAGDDESPEKHSHWGLIFSLSLSMFLSPCLEIEAYYLGASVLGLQAVFLVSVTFFVVTILSMGVLVFLAMHGLQKLNWPLLDHHGKTITGSVLVILGVISAFATWLH